MMGIAFIKVCDASFWCMMAWVLHLLRKNKSNICNTHCNPNTDTIPKTLWFVMGIASKKICDACLGNVMGIENKHDYLRLVD